MCGTEFHRIVSPRIHTISILYCTPGLNRGENDFANRCDMILIYGYFQWFWKSFRNSTEPNDFGIFKWLLSFFHKYWYRRNFFLPRFRHQLSFILSIYYKNYLLLAMCDSNSESYGCLDYYKHFRGTPTSGGSGFFICMIGDDLHNFQWFTWFSNHFWWFTGWFLYFRPTCDMIYLTHLPLGLNE